MHNNYYFIRQISAKLHTRLIGWTLGACFSQEKDELVLGFYQDEQEFYIKAVLKPDLACLVFPETFHRARKNSVDLFEELLGRKVQDVIQYRNDRSFSLILDNHYLMLFKLHGTRSNIILLQDGQVIDLFHSKMVADLAIRPDQLHRDIDQSYQAFERHNFQIAPLFPTFGKLVQRYLQEQSYASQPKEVQWQILQEVVQKLENPVFYLTLIDELPTLSLLPMGTIQEQSTDAFQAANLFYGRFTQITTLAKEKNAVIRLLEKKKTRTQNYLAKTYDKLLELEENSRNEQLANILMANLHQIPPRSESVELYDFYRDRPVTIKLKPDFSPQRNAEIYYRKAKNEKIEIQKLQEAIEEKEKELQEAEQHLRAISEIHQFRALRQYIKEHHLGDEDSTPTTPDQLFKRFEYMDYEIYVGRNAKNNDLLTQKFTFKEDLWLHAKDVTGSHVIIKYQAGKNFPEPVIERAASLAAYYSKLRNDTVCPVIVTPKKYVRKPKGLPEGAVVVDREKVIFVEPFSGQ